ncbi:MAG: hypothetical protein GTO45_05660 [Candidatus Aminicenantes bacterium]|nr:hypothetical protein [Candidatus Aminicenantes bacterium]NIM78337.1 hypothetical protein [Candidatus Aminicenantes bacterium]NIN17571.1 hypothetical protein [Candidatus Aminicenantes bacterium]NIN84223.1 hypothetical protein [Candidatus Aminicenantes bacterium]NIO80329.1 hypothetical protein [Candidatus Aminicenantes bacterium]
MFKEKYIEQVNILLRVLPFISRYREFAIKGGTAVNFFIFPVLRLSVDIDLCYLPVHAREESFEKMNRLILVLKKEIGNSLHEYSVHMSRSKNANVYKLFVAGKQSAIKIEPK